MARPGYVFVLASLAAVVACGKPARPALRPAKPPALVVGGMPSFAKQPRPPEWSFWEPVPTAMTPKTSAAPLPSSERELPREIVSSAFYQTLSESEKQLLGANGFVVRATKPERHLHEFYTKHGAGNVAQLLTLDALFSLVHASMEHLLVEIERDVMRPSLERWLTKLDLSLNQGVSKAKPDLERPARIARGIVAVARSLSDHAYSPPQDLAQAVQEELVLIRAHAGVSKSAILGHALDYSRFTPTGFAPPSSPGFSYWLTGQWLSHAPLVLTSREERTGSPQNTVSARDATRAAMLLARQSDDAIDKDASDALDALSRVLRFAFGPPDDASLEDLEQLADESRSDLGDDRVLGNVATVERFRKRLLTLRKPRLYDGIVPVPRRAGDLGDAPAQLASVRVLPPAWSEDAHALQIVSTSEGDRHKHDGLSPSGIDLVAYMGSDAARVAHRRAVENPDDYDALYSILQKSHPAETAPSRHASIFASYFDALSSYVVASAADPTQPVTLREPWQLHRAETALAAWATLRHDSFLFGRDVESARSLKRVPAGPRSPSSPRVYVEPHVEVLSKLVAMWLQMERGLQTIETRASQDALMLLGEVEAILRAALALSIEEVEGSAAPSVSGIDLLPRFMALNESLGAQEPAESGFVAIAHGYADTRVLEVGTGFFEEVVCLVRDPVSDRYVLAVGPAVPYFEESVRLAEVHTDSGWRTRMALTAPPRPAVFQVYRPGPK